MGVTRNELLDRAKADVDGPSSGEPGDPESTLGRVAEYWSIYLERDLLAEDVALMMSLMKIARLGDNFGHEDSWVDLAGYAAVGAEVALVAPGAATRADVLAWKAAYMEKEAAVSVSER